MTRSARRFARLTATTAAAGALAVTGALPAFSHGDDPKHAADTAQARQQFLAGASVPVAMSPNVELVNTFPDTQAIAGVFSRSAPFFYVSSLDGISVYNVSDPLAPRLTGTLPLANFENEAMNYGERRGNGAVTRFVLVGVDLYSAGTDPSHLNLLGGNMKLVDVTNPQAPYVRANLKGVTTSTHTVACVQQTDCRFAYTAGSRGNFSIIDLRNIDNPREVDSDPNTAGTQPFASPAAGPSEIFTRGAGHKWNFDAAGYGLHTGSAGTAIFDVSDPLQPRVVTDTNAQGTGDGWNDFIHHNSDRPAARNFQPFTAPSIRKGNVAVITEEDYENTDCSTAGSIQTWHVRKLSGLDGIVPLDRFNPVTEADPGLTPPESAFCSAHWFDYHRSGILAQGFYQGGLRLIDVRDPRNIKQYGYFTAGLSEVWDAYWVPRWDNGRVVGQTNIVYTADLVRGIDVLRVDLPGTQWDSGPAVSAAASYPAEPAAASYAAADEITIGGMRLYAGMAGAAALPLLLGAAMRRRRGPVAS